METTNYTTVQFNTLSPQEISKLEMKKINEYDFNKMLENFKFQDALLKLKKKRIQKIKTDNSLFQQNVHKMRLKTQEAEVKRIREIKRNIEEKTAEVESNQFEKNKEKKEKMLKARNDRIRMEKTAKSNVESHLANLEERRLEEAERTIDRLRSFQEKHNEMRQEKKMSYSKKLKENVDKYNQHYLIQMEREALLTQTREDEKLKKYTETFWKQKERMNKIKKKKEKHLVHLDKIREIKEQRENDLKRKKNRIMQKIESMIKKRNNLEEEHHRRLEEELREEENKKKEVTNRLEIIKRNENEFRDAVLLYQQDLIFRALDKENATNLKRSNAHESTVLNQIELERSLPKFNLEMNALKDESILKKSTEQRRKIYRELQLAEEEKRKKETEDKLLKQF